MKKLLLLIFLLNIGFSTVISGIGKNTDTMISNNKLDCIYIGNPDILLERMLNKLKKEKKSNDIFCDRDGMKMAYYLIEGEDYNLTLGIAIPVDLSTTNAQFKENFLKKLDEYRMYYLERGDGHRVEFRVGTEKKDDGTVESKVTTKIDGFISKAQTEYSAKLQIKADASGNTKTNLIFDNN